MATYTNRNGKAEKHGVRAIVTARGVEKIAAIWTMTSKGLTKIYESVCTCWDGKTWRGDKIWRGDVKW